MCLKCCDSWFSQSLSCPFCRNGVFPKENRITLLLPRKDQARTCQEVLNIASLFGDVFHGWYAYLYVTDTKGEKSTPWEDTKLFIGKSVECRFSCCFVNGFPIRGIRKKDWTEHWLPSLLLSHVGESGSITVKELEVWVGKRWRHEVLPPVKKMLQDHWIKPEINIVSTAPSHAKVCFKDKGTLYLQFVFFSKF